MWNQTPLLLLLNHQFFSSANYENDTLNIKALSFSIFCFSRSPSRPLVLINGRGWFTAGMITEWWYDSLSTWEKEWQNREARAVNLIYAWKNTETEICAETWSAWVERKWRPEKGWTSTLDRERLSQISAHLDVLWMAAIPWGGFFSFVVIFVIVESSVNLARISIFADDLSKNLNVLN